MHTFQDHALKVAPATCTYASLSQPTLPSTFPPPHTLSNHPATQPALAAYTFFAIPSPCLILSITRCTRSTSAAYSSTRCPGWHTSLLGMVNV